MLCFLLFKFKKIMWLFYTKIEKKDFDYKRSIILIGGIFKNFLGIKKLNYFFLSKN